MESPTSTTALRGDFSGLSPNGCFAMASTQLLLKGSPSGLISGADGGFSQGVLRHSASAKKVLERKGKRNFPLHSKGSPKGNPYAGREHYKGLFRS